jgi:xeroderma pigmentosum group C-complementing protein
VERALKRWAKLINGLRVRRRLQAEYGSGDAVCVLSRVWSDRIDMKLESQQRNPLANLADAPSKPVAKSAASVIATANQDAEKVWIGSVEDKSPRGDPIVIGDEEDEEPALEQPTASNEVVDIRSDTTEEMEEVEPPRLHEPVESAEKEAITPATTAAKTPTTKFTLRVNAARAPPAGRPKRQAARAAKRRAPSPAESEAQSSGSDGSAKRKVSKRAKRTVQAVPAPTRTLRSRSSKTEDQIKEEKEARERIRRAMASDEEMSDLDG